jgi:uncharacterized protein with GYD domain
MVFVSFFGDCGLWCGVVVDMEADDDGEEQRVSIELLMMGIIQSKHLLTDS